jgi:hypothetical protein
MTGARSSLGGGEMAVTVSTALVARAELRRPALGKRKDRRRGGTVRGSRGDGLQRGGRGHGTRRCPF